MYVRFVPEVLGVTLMAMPVYDLLRGFEGPFTPKCIYDLFRMFFANTVDVIFLGCCGTDIVL